MEISLQLISVLFETPGTLMIAYAALSVHHRVLHEHTIDEVVFKSMKREQRIGKIGVLLVMIGFILQLLHFLS
jgi:hypothetical protein